MFNSIAVQTASESANIQTLIFTILLAFLLSLLLAYVYQKTAGEKNQSKTYIQSVILISLISAVIIQAIGDSLARGVGIMAAMSIIRFRNNLRDPRDLLFVFASLSVGISCGAYAFGIAIIGTLGFSLAVIILYLSPLGPDAEKPYNGVLKCQLSAKTNDKKHLDRFLNHYCHNYLLDSIKDMEDDKLEYAFKISLKENFSYVDLLTALKQIPSVAKLTLKTMKG